MIAETGWLIERQLGPAAEARFYASITEGDLTVEPLTSADWGRISELVETYADLAFGGVDASVVAVAERLGVHEIATLDRRDFSVVRPKHVDVLTLLP